VAGPRNHIDAGVGQARRHVLRDRPEPLVALSDHELDRDGQLVEAVPQRRERARAQPPQCVGEALGGIAEAVGVGRRARAFRLAVPQRQPAPLGGERLDPDRLDPVGQHRVGAAARLPLARIGQARARADQHEPTDALRPRERRVQGDASAERVAGEHVRLVEQGAQVRERRRQRGRAPLAHLPVTREVGRDRAIASVERRDGPPPALPRLGEAVQEDQRRAHAHIMPPDHRP